MSKFIHLHNHTEFSLLDGCGKIDNFVARVKELNMSHFAVTEHGSMRSFYHLHLACKKHNVNPIYGIEFYMANDMNAKGVPEHLKTELAVKFPKSAEYKAALKELESRLRVRHRDHLCAFAKDNDGLRNLFRLSSFGWLDGFYYRPRIDKALLLKYKAGLMVSSACVAGTIPRLLLEGKQSEAIQEAVWWMKNFGDDFYLELMPHSFPDQIRANAMVLDLAKRLNIKMIATNDCHYINAQNAYHQEILLCINTNDKLSNPKRFKFDTQEFWLKSIPEMVSSFMDHHDMPTADIRSAMLTTVEVAEKAKATVVLNKFKCLLPPVDVDKDIREQQADEQEAQFKQMVRLCLKGWDWRNMEQRAVEQAPLLGVTDEELLITYKERLKLELAAIKRQVFTGYFLIVHELIGWAKSQGIMVGPGRGSSAGSIVCYLLGITALDPIEHGLLFERFMSPSRIDMPDIDMDFQDSRRGEVVNHLREKYGQANVSQIGTIVQMKGKMCLKDVCRVMEVPLSAVNSVTSSIVERSSGDERASQTVEDSFKEFDVCKEFNKTYPAVLPAIIELEGQARQTGMHAAGVITSPVPIHEVVPIETKDDHGKRVPIAAINFWGCEDLGLLKLDVLGIRTLSVIKDALLAIKDRHGQDIDMESLPLNDPAVLENFTQMKFPGVFQFDTTSMYKTCGEITFTSFADIAALCALNRPGTMRSGLATKYVERKNDPSKIQSFHPIVDKICQETLGILVYQEQLTQIFIQLSGYEPGTADSLRKLVAKKHGDELLGKERDKFVAGAKARGLDEDLANKLMDQITFFGSYAFNKSHSCAYGVISYWCMWLKTYYPLEFMWSTLKNEPDRKEVMRFIKESKRMGLEILEPDVNESGAAFTLAGNKIRCGLIDIKGVGESAISALVRKQPFTSVVDLLQRVDRRLVKKNTIDVLVKAGAMATIVPNVKSFLEHAESIFKAADKKEWPAVQKIIDDSRSEIGYTETEMALVAAEVSPLPMGQHPLTAYGDFLDSLPMTFTRMDEDFWSKKDGFFFGQITDLRYNQVGDFATVEPSEQEKKKMRWGARYSNFNVEDVTGDWNRVKLDVDPFIEFRDVVDKGIGTPVLFRAQISVGNGWKTIKAYQLVDLKLLRIKTAAGQPLSFWEKYFLEHPLSGLKSENDKLLLQKVRGRVKMNALVISARHTIDKRGQEMAHFELDVGYDKRPLRIVCFHGAYKKFKGQLRMGVVALFDLKRESDSLRLDEQGSIVINPSLSDKKVLKEMKRS